MKRILFVLVVIAAAGAMLLWVLSAPRPRYTQAEWQALGLSGDAAAGRLVFFASGCDSATSRPVRMIRCDSVAGSNSRRRSDPSIRRISQAIRSRELALGARSKSPTRCCRAFPRRAGTSTRPSPTPHTSG